MDQIREQTRRQNLASAQLERSKLEGWEAPIDAILTHDPGPEIVVVTSTSTSSTPVSSPRESAPIAETLPETLEALDRAVDQLLERGHRTAIRNPMGPPHRPSNLIERDRSGSLDASTLASQDNRRNDFGEAFASAASALTPLPPLPPQLSEAIKRLEESASQTTETPSPHEESPAREAPAATASASDSSSTASTFSAPSDLAPTLASSKELSSSDRSPEPATLAAAPIAEKSARHREGQDRIGRTIARQIFELPPLLDASSLLLVATGGIRRALDYAESVGRGIAWHLDRPVQMVTFESHEMSVWNELSEVAEESPIISAWRDAARVVRLEREERFTSLELAIESGDSRRLRPATVRTAARRSRRGDACEIWLVDVSEKEICETLGAICDATILLVDLLSSEVESCREATQHLRERGARLVGSIAIHDFEER